MSLFTVPECSPLGAQPPAFQLSGAEGAGASQESDALPGQLQSWEAVPTLQLRSEVEKGLSCGGRLPGFGGSHARKLPWCPEHAGGLCTQKGRELLGHAIKIASPGDVLKQESPSLHLRCF